MNGRGAWHPGVALAGAALLLLLTPLAVAQRVSILNDGQYRPGEYAPLRIESDGPGLIQIRGPEMIGIDWTAPGKTSITVPWMCWRTTSLETSILVNGAARPISLRPVSSTESFSGTNPYAVAGKVAGKTVGPTSAMYSDDAYSPTYAWTPGRPEQTRRWLVLASVLTVLTLLAIRLALWKSRWTAVAMGVAGVGMAVLFSQRSELARRDSRMTVQIISADPPQCDTWTYLASGVEQRIEAPWSGSAMLVPRSPAHLQALDPVLRVDESGLPQAISVQVRPDRLAAVLQRSTDPSSPIAMPGDSVVAPELVRMLYGQAYTVDRQEGLRMRLTPSSPR